MREQIELLERANEQEKANESLVGALRREAEQRKFQEAAALSALEELRERQHLAAEEGREKAKMLEEREAEIKLQQEAHQRQIAELEAQLAKLQESVESQQVDSPRVCLRHVHLCYVHFSRDVFVPFRAPALAADALPCSTRALTDVCCQHVEAGVGGGSYISPAKRRSWRNSGSSDDGLPDEFFCSITLVRDTHTHTHSLSLARSKRQTQRYAGRQTGTHMHVRTDAYTERQRRGQ